MLKFVPINAMVQCKPVPTKVCSITKEEKFDWKLLFVGNAPNYYRNTFNGPDVTSRDQHLEHATFESGMATRHEANADDNYSQPRVFYQVNLSNSPRVCFFFDWIYLFFKNVLDERGRTHMINNIAEHLAQCTDRDIVRRAVLIFANVDEDFGRRLAQKLNIDLPGNVKSDAFSFSFIEIHLLVFFYVDIKSNSNDSIEILDYQPLIIFFRVISKEILFLSSNKT